MSMHAITRFKNELKWVLDLNIKPNTTKILEEILRETGLGKYFWLNVKAWVRKNW